MIERRRHSLRAPDGRPIEVSVYAPDPDDAHSTTPIIIFSHGANAAPSLYVALLEAWAAAGFLVLAPFHTDSEVHPARIVGDGRAVRQTRFEDFRAVVEMLAGQGLLDTGYVAAGHSYGALVAQGAGGAVLDPETAIAADGLARPICVVALSPPPAIPGLIGAGGWAKMTVPSLCVTGTADEMPGFAEDWRRHLDSFHAAPNGFAMIFEGMDHYFNGAFGRVRSGDAARDRAVRTLNQAVIDFVNLWQPGSGSRVVEWLAGETGAARRRCSRYEHFQQ